MGRHSAPNGQQGPGAATGTFRDGDRLEPVTNPILLDGVRAATRIGGPASARRPASPVWTDRDQADTDRPDIGRPDTSPDARGGGAPLAGASLGSWAAEQAPEVAPPLRRSDPWSTRATADPRSRTGTGPEESWRTAWTGETGTVSPVTGGFATTPAPTGPGAAGPGTAGPGTAGPVATGPAAPSSAASGRRRFDAVAAPARPAGDPFAPYRPRFDDDEDAFDDELPPTSAPIPVGAAAAAAATAPIPLLERRQPAAPPDDDGVVPIRPAPSLVTDPGPLPAGSTDRPLQISWSWFGVALVAAAVLSIVAVLPI